MRIKILFFAANPMGTPRLMLDEEIRAITSKIRAAEYRDLLEVVSAWAVRPDDLLQMLNQHKPHIVHFSGHGSRSGEIILVDEKKGVPKPVSAEALKALFEVLRDNVRIVVLNACYSRIQAEAIAQVIDCVVGMSSSIDDQAAIVFAASFYRALAFGRSVREAFEQGKVALQLEGMAQDAGIPEIVVRRGVDTSTVFLLEESERVSESRNVVEVVKRHTEIYVESLSQCRTVIEREIENEVVRWIRSTQNGGIGIVVGEAGVGKTCLLSTIAKRLLNRPEFAVLFFKSEDFLGEDLEEAMLNALGLKGKVFSLDEIFGELAKLKKRIVMLLDTLDLIAFNHGPTRLRRMLLQLRKYNAIFMGATRPREYGEFKEIIDKKFSLAPFSVEEIRELLVIMSVPRHVQEMVLGHRRLIDIARNPLHFRMLVNLIRKYPHFVAPEIGLRELFDVYWSTKINDLRSGLLLPKGLSKRQICNAKEEIVKHIALIGYKTRSLFVKERVIYEKFLGEPVYDFAYTDLLSEGVLQKYGFKVGFFHQTFWEYTVAKVLIEQERVEEIVDNAWYPLYAGIIYQIGLQIQDERNTFAILVNKLRNAPFLSKVILVDILTTLPDLSGEEISLLKRIVMDDFRLVDYLIGLVIYQGGRLFLDRIFSIIEELARGPQWEIRRRIAEALPRLIETDPARAANLMRIMRLDYDERKWRADIRRRVVEALPVLSQYLPDEAIEIAEYQPRDEVYTAVAVIEFLDTLPEVYEDRKKAIINELRSTVLQDYIFVVDFMEDMFDAVRNNPDQALQRLEAARDDNAMITRICAARMAPRLFLARPSDVLDLLYYCARPAEHKNVRRAVTKSMGEIIRYLKSGNYAELVPLVKRIILRLSEDPDDIIRLTLCDYLYDLMEVMPDTVRTIVVDKFARDENLYVRTRTQKLILRLVYFFPEDREALLCAIEETR